MNDLMINFYHPAIGFVVLGLLLPFLKGENWWKPLLLLPPLAAIVTACSFIGVEKELQLMTLPWMGNFELKMGRVDKLAVVFAHVFAIQSLIGFIYSLHIRDKYQHIAACFYVGGAFGCVFAKDYLTLFLFWEMMSVASTLLIWFNHLENKKAASAGLRYFLIHTLGGLFILAGMLLRYKAVGNWDFNHVPFDTAHLYDVLIMIGIGVNAAFIGLHAWLPDAYPEATITGAVFMSAFTTKTAVYTLARGFAGWDILAYIGVGMALYGVFYATMENNARRILSYHIVSQVGYMVAGIGIGTAMTINGACAHAYAHILYKGLLFMSVGAILYSCGTAKLTELGGLVGRLPLVMICYVVAGLSISGWPVFNGFVSKTMTIAGAFEDHQVLLGIGMELAAVGTFLSVGIKLPYFAFWAKPNDEKRTIKPIPWNMYLAMIIGAGLCIAQGLFPGGLLYIMLPEAGAMDFHAWGAYHVLQAVMLLSFTGLGFYVLRKVMEPHEQLNLDFDWYYRLGGRWFYGLVSKPLAWFDSIWTEVYAKIGLKGLMSGASASDVFDRNVIDGVLDGSALATKDVIGGTSSQSLTGRLSDYVGGALVAGFIVFVLVWIFA